MCAHTARTNNEIAPWGRRQLEPLVSEKKPLTFQRRAGMAAYTCVPRRAQRPQAPRAGLAPMPDDTERCGPQGVLNDRTYANGGRAARSACATRLTPMHGHRRNPGGGGRYRAAEGGPRHDDISDRPNEMSALADPCGPGLGARLDPDSPRWSALKPRYRALLAPLRRQCTHTHTHPAHTQTGERAD